MPRELSSSKLLNNGNGSTLLNNDPVSNTHNVLSDFEELVVTIKKSERGFGFDLKNGILIQNVYPSKIILNSFISLLSN